MKHSDVLFRVDLSYGSATPRTEQHVSEGPVSSIHGFTRRAFPVLGLGGRLLHVLAGGCGGTWALHRIEWEATYSHIAEVSARQRSEPL